MIKLGLRIRFFLYSNTLIVVTMTLVAVLGAMYQRRTLYDAIVGRGRSLVCRALVEAHVVGLGATDRSRRTASEGIHAPRSGRPLAGSRLRARGHAVGCHSGAHVSVRPGPGATEAGDGALAGVAAASRCAPPLPRPTSQAMRSGG